MIQRGNAQEIVVVSLFVMAVFDVAARFEVCMGQKDRFGSSGCAGGKIEGRIVATLETYPGRNAFRAKKLIVRYRVGRPHCFRSQKNEAFNRF
jgi:hypothetical protein